MGFRYGATAVSRRIEHRFVPRGGRGADAGGHGEPEAPLIGCGLGLEQVVSARVFLTHFDHDYERMNAVYASYFSAGKRPARTCVGVTALARGARVEIDLIARRTQERRRRARQ